MCVRPASSPAALCRANVGVERHAFAEQGAEVREVGFYAADQARLADQRCFAPQFAKTTKNLEPISGRLDLRLQRVAVVVDDWAGATTALVLVPGTEDTLNLVTQAQG
ncbi:MAG: hypothetical protein JWL78_1268 [Chloroflexi bacterium]|nr:hypothetical protein [Chloroflexota bacterium]